MRLWVRYRSYLLTIAFAAILSAASLIVAGKSYELGGISASVSARPSPSGHTVLELPPLGQVSASTHRSPIEFRVTLKNVDLNQVQGLLAGDKLRNDLIADVIANARKAATDFAFRILIFGGLAGLAGGALFMRLSFRRLLLGAATGLATSALLISATYSTFDPVAFHEPKYSGALKAAPAIIGDMRTQWRTFEDYTTEIQQVASNMSRFYQTVSTFKPIDEREGLVSVLHISDIHDNPAAYDLVDRVTKTFPVDFIVDTGDISDFGTGFEADLTQGIKKLGLPYLWVAGNHDSPTIVRAMKKLPGVTVLDGETQVKGIRVAGYPDPRSSVPMVAAPDAKANDRRAQSIEDRLRSAADPPAILMAHNPKLAAKAIGRVPIILTGHTHTAKITRKDGTWMINAGTTGGAGLRTFTKREGIPMTLQMLYIEPTSKRLVAIDSISVWGSQREFTLERHVNPDPEQVWRAAR